MKCTLCNKEGASVGSYLLQLAGLHPSVHSECMQEVMEMLRTQDPRPENWPMILKKIYEEFHE